MITVPEGIKTVREENLLSAQSRCDLIEHAPCEEFSLTHRGAGIFFVMAPED